MLDKEQDEITYPFPNFNGCTVVVWEWISDFIPHFIMYLITYSCWWHKELQLLLFLFLQLGTPIFQHDGPTPGGSTIGDGSRVSSHRYCLHGWSPCRYVLRNIWLTYCGRVMHICISKFTIIYLDNGLSPGWCQAII